MASASINADYGSFQKSSTPVLVSVIIPVYNVAMYLHECIDSVIKQSYKRLEIILIDDGSTDESGMICDYYRIKDSRIRVIHQSNHGLGYTRNRGLHEATGDYIIFLDSDDYWRTDTIETIVRIAIRDKIQVLLFSAIPFFDGIESFKASYDHSAQNNIVKTGMDSVICAKRNREYYSQVCLRMYKLQYLLDQGFQFDEGIVHEDESFSFLSYINANRIECIGEQLYYRRFRSGSLMMECDPVQSSHGYRVAIDTILEYLDNHEVSLQERKVYKKQVLSYIISIFQQYKKLDDDRTKEPVLKKCDLRNIVSDSSNSFKIAIHRLMGLHFRIILHNFYVGYYVWRLKNQIGLINQCFKGLRD